LAKICTFLRIHADHEITRWDDWVPQERVRKLNEENKELATNLRKDMEAQRRATTGKPSSTSTKKRPFGSDLTASSARGSEDRSSAVPPPPPRGTKRGRDIEGIDKVSVAACFEMRFAGGFRNTVPAAASGRQAGKQFVVRRSVTFPRLSDIPLV
jgi:hypothetical protein